LVLLGVFFHPLILWEKPAPKHLKSVSHKTEKPTGNQQNPENCKESMHSDILPPEPVGDCNWPQNGSQYTMAYSMPIIVLIHVVSTEDDVHDHQIHDNPFH
jgi:hypothetical protein